MEVFLLSEESRNTTAITPVNTFDNVTEGTLQLEVNGEFTIKMKVRRPKLLPKVGNCIGFQPPDYTRLQKFVIKNTKEYLDGTIEVYAEHISYDLLTIPFNPAKKMEYNSNVEYLAKGILDGAIGSHNFTIGDVPSKTENRNMKMGPQYFGSLREAFGGHEGSLLDTFPGLMYRFDNEIINIYYDFGKDLGLAAYKGHNLLDMTQEEDILETYDAVLPYAKKEIEGNEQIVYMDDINIRNTVYPTAPTNDFKNLRIKTVDLSDKWENLPTKFQLYNEAIKYYRSISGIKRKMESNILDLSKSLNAFDGKEINLFDKIDLPFRDEIYKLPVTSIVINILNGRREKLYVNKNFIEKRKM